MLHEMDHGNDLILYLKEQIEFFKSEFREKTEVISTRWVFQSSHPARINVSAAARIIFK